MAEEDIVYEFDESSGALSVEANTPRLRIVHLDNFEPPFTLSAHEHGPYLRRFATLFIDEARTREGGNASILHASNAFGEQFALKVHKGPSDREYRIHRAVSGIKGYPALYGRAQFDGSQVHVMEWIEGEDLLSIQRRFSIDDDLRVSPLVAARIGRDLFDVLARTNVLEDSFVHGDLSPRNVMVSVRAQSLDGQAQEGSFDLRLIDLGSACLGDVGLKSDTSSDSLSIAPATQEYAAPEFRKAKNKEGVLPLSPSAAGDVYAASRIVLELLCGKEPFSKKTAHSADNDLSAVLVREPEVAVALTRAASELIPAPTQSELAAALQMVDDQLIALLECGLSEDPKKRPSATAMRDALDSFSCLYTSNLGYALRGEQLDPCNAPFMNRGFDRLSLRLRNRLRVVGKSVSLGLLAAVVAMTAFSFAVGQPKVSWSGIQIEGLASEVLVALLLFPLCLGMVLRGKERYSSSGLVRGSLGVFGAGLCFGFLAYAAHFSPSSFHSLMISAVFATTVMAWCPIVLDRVFSPQSANIRKRSLTLPSASTEKRDEYHTVPNVLGSGGDENQP